MTFQLSPSVTVTETDLTNIIPAVATSTGATVGEFVWGPVEEITIVDNEEALVALFGKPNDTTFKDFFSAASFLAYAEGLKLVRVVNETGDSNTDGAINATGTASAAAGRSRLHSSAASWRECRRRAPGRHRRPDFASACDCWRTCRARL